MLGIYKERLESTNKSHVHIDIFEAYLMWAGCGPGRAVNVALSAQPSQLKVLVQSIGLKYRPVFRYRVQVLLASIGRVSDTSIGIGTSLMTDEHPPR